jgi:hypothetical protein
MNKIIYSAMIGGYDEIHPIKAAAGWECIMFTDMPISDLPVGTGWQFRPACLSKGVNNILVNRWYKMHPHVLFPDNQESIYIDANIQINSFEIIERQILLLNADDIKVAITDHLFRDCIYKEAVAVVEHKKDTQKNVDVTMSLLKRSGYPESHGLYENNFIYRQHSDATVVNLMRQWWHFINQYSSRDQLSLCYLIWLNGVNSECFFGQGVSVRNNQDITFYPDHIVRPIEMNADKPLATHEKPLATHEKPLATNEKTPAVNKNILSPRLRLCLFLCKLLPGRKIRVKLRKFINDEN